MAGIFFLKESGDSFQCFVQTKHCHLSVNNRINFLLSGNIDLPVDELLLLQQNVF